MPSFAPDLIVQSISTPGNSDIQVVIKNVGNEATGTGFWVDLYVNPNPVPSQPNQIWPFVASQGAVWGITSAINPGGSMTLNIGDANYWPSLSNLPATLPAGSTDLCASGLGEIRVRVTERFWKRTRRTM